MESLDLRKAGLKVTHPRMRILALMDEIRPRHMTAEDIYRHLLDRATKSAWPPFTGCSPSSRPPAWC